MEHSQRSTDLEFFSFLVVWEVFERSSSILGWNQKPKSTFLSPLWEQMYLDNHLRTRVYQWFCKVLILVDKWQPTVDTLFLDALKGKGLCCILLSDRCPCGLGPRRQWNGISESWEIRGSARQWDSNKIWSLHETSEAESLYTVCAGSW